MPRAASGPMEMFVVTTSVVRRGSRDDEPAHVPSGALHVLGIAERPGGEILGTPRSAAA